MTEQYTPTDQQRKVMLAVNSIRIDGITIPAAFDKVNNLLVATRIILDGGDSDEAFYSEAVLDVAESLLCSVKSYLSGGDPEEVGYSVSMNIAKH